MGFFEDIYFGREAIKIGCIVVGVAIDLQVSVSNIVGKYEDNIWVVKSEGGVTQREGE